MRFIRVLDCSPPSPPLPSHLTKVSSSIFSPPAAATTTPQVQAPIWEQVRVKEERQHQQASTQSLISSLPSYSRASQMELTQYYPEPQLQSCTIRVGATQPPGLMSNGWEPLHIEPSAGTVIPGLGMNTIGNHYRVSHKIGSGSFGEIFLGVDIRTNERVAIKVENRNTKYPQLAEEYHVYLAVAKGIGVPSARWFGSSPNLHIMVMDLLGDNLETLYNQCGRKFSLKTITLLAIQLLHRIEYLHERRYIHRVS